MMRHVRLWGFVLAFGIVGTEASPAGARTLASELAGFIQQGGRLIQQTQFPDTITPVIVRLGAQATDFPVPPTTPGAIFVYNPQEGIFERAKGSLGPVFLERVDTVGENHASIGVSFLYGNVDLFDGSTLAQGNNTKIGAVFDTNTGQRASAGVTLDRFSLPTYKVSFAARYGVTDDFDVSFLLPLVVTKLKVAGRVFAATGQRMATTEAIPVDDSSVGVGDLLLRAKYRFGYLYDWGFAAGMVLRVPTGDDENFHGLGDTTIQPTLIISRAFGVQDVHANLGMEFNAANGERSRARYGIGATLMWPGVDWAAFLLDFIGTSGLDNEHFATTVRFPSAAQPVGVITPFATGSVQNPDGSFTIFSTLPRTDQFNAAVGFKFDVWQNLIAYANAVVPITRQGLQADVISAVGLEYSF